MRRFLARVLLAVVVSVLSASAGVAQNAKFTILPEESTLSYTPQTMSERGIEVLKAFESFRHRAYQVGGVGYYIGFGFQTWKGHRVTLGYPGYVTLVQAETELRHQLIMYEEIVRTVITISLMQHQFDALVSLAYNTGNLGGKRFITKVNSGNKVDERDFTRTVMAHLLTDRNVLRVLINRRKVEHQLYAGRR